ncbi:MAG: 30S ribosomal protein S3 [Candidatus Aenigmarchaeota archaeon]|nr:30S ribosomal protein S3 [Candidatus Aenigmarchaeota archaeon]
MLKQYFVKLGVKEVELEEFIKTKFPAGDYSKIALNRTPLGLKIIIFTNKPGRIIGRGGRNIEVITRSLKERFGMDNPQIDIKSIDKPDLDSRIVAKQIASALEMGYNYKKIGNIFLKRIMDAGAVGAQIVVSGKLGGAMSRMVKFTQGYIQRAGQPSIDAVDTGFHEARPKLGKIGITVRILKEFRDITGEVKDLSTLKKFEEVKVPETKEDKEVKEVLSEVIEEKKEEKPKPVKVPRNKKEPKQEQAKTDGQ